MPQIFTITPIEYTQNDINNIANKFITGETRNYWKHNVYNIYQGKTIAEIEFQNILEAIETTGVIIYKTKPLQFLTASGVESILGMYYGVDLCVSILVMDKAMDTTFHLYDYGNPSLAFLKQIKTRLETDVTTNTSCIAELERYIESMQNHESIYTIEDIRGIRSIYRRCGGWEWKQKRAVNLRGDVTVTFL